MNEQMQNIADVIKSTLDKANIGSFNVTDVRTGDGDERRRGRITNDESNLYKLSLIVNSDASAAENDPTFRNQIATALSESEPLNSYIDFKMPEEPKKHLQELATKYQAVLDKALAAGLDVSSAPGEWFKEQIKLQELKETSPESTVYIGLNNDNYAVNVNRNDNFISISIPLPAGVNAEEAQKSVEARSDAIKSLLARMTAKKRSQDPAEQAAIIEQVKNLDMVVTTQSWGSGTNLNIEFRSKQVTEAMQQPGGLAALDQEKLKALKETNPLMLLKDGDDLTPDNPAQLQKAISRAILFEGEKGEKPIALFAKIAGPRDVKRVMEKSFAYIKANKPELAADVDALLKDKLFEEHGWGATKNKDGSPIKQQIVITKQEAPTGYVPGQYRIDLSIPIDKFQEVTAQLAALNTPAPAQAPAPDAPQSSTPAAETVAAAANNDWIKRLDRRKQEQGAEATVSR